MNKTIRQGTLALVLIGGIALLAAPASANSIHNNGHFGGSWSRIGPGGPERHHRYARRYYDRGYTRGYAYGYGPRAYYGAPYGYYGDYAPGIGVWGPGFGVGIGF